MLNFDVIKNSKKSQNQSTLALLWAVFWAVWGERGVAEFKLRLQADFNLGFTRPAPQAGVRRMKNGLQNGAKIDAKMDPPK